MPVENIGYAHRDTRSAAHTAIKTKAPTLRQRALRTFQSALTGLTADECAKLMGASIMQVRPRVCELADDMQITDTGKRRVNDSGKLAIVWAT
jgi:hypothetical protein